MAQGHIRQNFHKLLRFMALFPSLARAGLDWDLSNLLVSCCAQCDLHGPCHSRQHLGHPHQIEQLVQHQSFVSLCLKGVAKMWASF